jgi:hypothetical protein
MDDHGANWNFSRVEGTLGGAESGFHEELIGERAVVGRWSSVVGWGSMVLSRRSRVRRQFMRLLAAKVFLALYREGSTCWLHAPV